MSCTAEVYQLPSDLHGTYQQCTLVTARKEVSSSASVMRDLLHRGTITKGGDFIVIMDDIANLQRRVYRHRVREVVERRLALA